MVRHTAYSISVPPLLFDDTIQIGLQLLFVFKRDDVFTILGSENDMINMADMTHKAL